MAMTPNSGFDSDIDDEQLEEEGTGRVTKRARQREREDRAFMPVILKRIDTSRRHADDIMEQTIGAGLEQLKRAPRSLALSSFAGGMALVFSVMAVGVMKTAVTGLDEPLQRLALAFVYPLGFIICIVSGMELFTEHTATAVYPVLDRRAPLWRLARLWAVVLTGNLLGAVAGSAMLAAAEPVVHASAGYVAIAHEMVSPPVFAIFVSAVIAGSLMAVGGWLVYATPHEVSTLLVIYLVTFLIGLAGLHHSIAGTAELATAALVGGGPSPERFVLTIGLAIGGNVVGGSFVVALLNYGHVRRSQAVEER